MPDLRDRLRALDDLEVPDVMQQARRLGPKPPMIQSPRPVRRVVIAAFALLLAVASVLYVSRAFDRSEAPLPPVQSPEQPTSCRWDATTMTISYPGASRRSAARFVAGTSLDDLWVLVSNHPWSDQHLLHYDGQAWREVDLPQDLGPSFPSDMAAPVRNDLWLLSGHGVARFDGTTWSRSEFPKIEGVDERYLAFNDLELVAPNDAWVTGNLSDPNPETPGPVVLHWDGATWNPISLVSVDEDALERVVGVSGWTPDDVWIAGASGGQRPGPTSFHWDGSAWTSRPVVGPDTRAVSGDTSGLVAAGPDEALMTVNKGVLRWGEDGWLGTGFEATSSMDVPLSMERATSGVWAKVWNTGAARWNGRTWRVESLKHIYSYGMTTIDDAAVFVGSPLSVYIIGC